MTLTLVTPPAAEPVTLDEFKAWAKVDTDADDALIEALLTAARDAAEQFCNRAFLTQTWKLSLDLCPGRLADLPAGVYDLPVSALYDTPGAVALPKTPIQSITSVLTYDTANASSTYSASNYSLIGDRLVLNSSASWPSNLRAYGAIDITYVAGYGDAASSVPQPIRTAILMHAQSMYDSRTECDLPAPCESLLRKYRVYRA